MPVKRVLVCILAMALSLAQVASALPSALGVVVESRRAQLGSGAATPGTTLFDGDRLTTDSEGSLRLRTGNTILYLPRSSGISLRQTPTGPQSTLFAGTVVVSMATESSFAVSADGALLRPSTKAATLAQVTLVGPKELQVFARRGSLQFSYNGESEQIPEGTAYRVILDPSDDPSSGPPPQTRQNRTGRYHIGFCLLIIAGTAWATGWAIHEAFESPDRP